VSGKPRGTLIIVGGHEDRTDKSEILKQVSKRATGQRARLTVVTVATEQPEEMAKEYVAVFKKLGVRHVDVLDIRSRDQAHADAAVDKIREASVIFFTGGDQLRITSQVGDSPVYRCMQERYHAGATVAGTSAGAAAMPETMLISGPGDESHEISALGMAPGLALIGGVVIDSHFAERGRFGRLLGAVAQNPRNLGLGIDEDTAIVVKDGSFTVLGSGAVYVLDGADVSYSSLSEQSPEGILSVFDARIHVLGKEDRFDLTARRPMNSEEEERRMAS
jgi:cyanophycinase